MRRFLTLSLILLLFCSCTTDPTDLEIAPDLFLKMVDSGKYDTTVEGLYKGIFTTLDGTKRGTMEVILPQAPYIAQAYLTLSDGTLIKASGNRTRPNQVEFKNPLLSFSLKVPDPIETPIVENVVFNQKESDVFFQKQTSKASLTAVSGYYYCIECGFHPDLTAIDTQTLNFIFSGNGEGNEETVITQLTLNGDIYTNLDGGNGATQVACAPSGNFTTCKMQSGGSAGSVAFYGKSGPVYMTGQHIYNSNSEVCTSVFGRFRYISSKFGTIIAGFQSDGLDECAVPIAKNISFEGFEDDDVIYKLTRTSNGQEIPESFSAVSDSKYGYYGKFIGSNPSNVSYSYKSGLGYFAAQNTNNAPNKEVSITLLFDNGGEDYDITGKSEVTVESYFATFKDASVGGWTRNCHVSIEYSFDKGFTWESLIELAAGPNATNSKEDAVYLDADFDGIGDTDQTLITNEFTEVEKTVENISKSSTFRARIVIKKLDKENRDIAIDNFNISAE